MRIGLFGGALSGVAEPGIEDIIRHARRAEDDGFASLWLANIFTFDALTLLGVLGRETSRIELGTAVVPTYPRHPVALAQQALTVQALSGNRLALGIGLSHKVVIEEMFGLDFSHPVRHMRDYLTVLNGLLSGEQARFQGDEYRVAARFQVPGATRPPVLVAALGPAMLRLTGRLADGTVTWLGGLAYLRDVAVPAITRAAEEAGRPAPRIVAALPVAVTTDPDAARAAANEMFAVYGQLPSYRATLDRGGASGPGDVAILGSEAAVEEQVQALAAAGVTDLVASIFTPPGSDAERTYQVMARLAAGQRVG